MKHINRLFLFLLGALVFVGCKKDDGTLNTRVSAVKTIFSPADNYTANLSNISSVLFEWDQARAEDGGIVLYTVVFAKADGNFDKPLYTISSDGNGLQNKATLDKSTLNKIGKLAGLQSLQSGDFKWTVFSSKGVNVMPADSSRKITIIRPSDFDHQPAQLYLTGSATEGGTDLAKALKVKQIDVDHYEIYTSLKAGTYHFVDKTSGSEIHQYYIENNMILEGDKESTIEGGAAKPYRISLDLGVKTTKLFEIKELGLWFAPNNKIQFTLNYDKNGTWIANNELVTFKQESWGGDERYKFRMQVNDGTADAYEWWGSINGDNSRATSSSPASYFFLLPAPANQWDNCYKFQTEADKAHCDFMVSFSSDIENYTHKVTIK
ncbi:MAG TPA: SusE domain-containing protein [Arachidicoccus sp.]|nr:SusE domain-containing protein [Arachidicoccus sp.]